MCSEFQFYGNSRVICSELQKPAGSQNPSATTGSQNLSGSGVVLVIPQELHRSLQKAEQPLFRCLALCSSCGCSSLQYLGRCSPVCSFPVPKLGSAGVVGVLEQLEGNGMAC